MTTWKRHDNLHQKQACIHPERNPKWFCSEQMVCLRCAVLRVASLLPPTLQREKPSEARWFMASRTCSFGQRGLFNRSQLLSPWASSSVASSSATSIPATYLSALATGSIATGYERRVAASVRVRMCGRGTLTNSQKLIWFLWFAIWNHIYKIF